jgi:hypothetical protein
MKNSFCSILSEETHPATGMTTHRTARRKAIHMKSDSPKKGRSSRSTQSEVPGPSSAPESPQEVSKRESGGPSPEVTPGRRVSGGAKQRNRRDLSKQAKPPVRIVSDLPPKREIASRSEQAQPATRAAWQPASAGKVTAERIAQRAYELYQAGGYESGREIEHWLEAERQLEAEQRGSS